MHFNPLTSRLGVNQRLRYKDGHFIAESATVRKNQHWLFSFFSRYEYSQSRILNKIQKLAKSRLTKEENKILTANYTYLIKRAEIQNEQWISYLPIMRFLLGKAHITLREHSRTLEALKNAPRWKIDVDVNLLESDLKEMEDTIANLNAGEHQLSELTQDLSTQLEKYKKKAVHIERIDLLNTCTYLKESLAKMRSKSSQQESIWVGEDPEADVMGTAAFTNLSLNNPETIFAQIDPATLKYTKEKINRLTQESNTTANSLKRILEALSLSKVKDFIAKNIFNNEDLGKHLKTHQSQYRQLIQSACADLLEE